MMKYLLHLLLFSLLSFSAIADSLPRSVSSPSLWKMELNGQQGYLFGSIHFGSADMYPLPDTVYKRLNDSDVLMLEADIRPETQAELMPILQRAGFDPAKPLSRSVSPETYRRLEQYSQEHHLPLALMAAMKPWMASMTITVAQLQQLGYSADQGVEYHLINVATKQNMALAFLETAAYQIGLLSSMSIADQEYMLLGAMETKKESIQEMISSWQHGDIEQFLKAYMAGVDLKFADRFNQLLLQDRNIGMAEGIANSLKNGKRPFVAVGAAHLVGQGSVVELLQKQHITVTPVKY